MASPRASVGLKRVWGAVGAALLIAGAGTAGAGTWGGNYGGNWSDATRWAGSDVPNSNGAVANLTYDISPDRSVTVDVAVAVGTVLMQDTSGSPQYNWLIGGPGPLTLGTVSGSAQVRTATATSNRFDAPLVLEKPVVLVLDQGTGLTLGGNISGTGSVMVGTGQNTYGERGRLTITGTNTFTGDFFTGYDANASYGPIEVGSDAAFGQATLRLRGERLRVINAHRVVSNAVSLEGDAGIDSTPYGLTIAGPGVLTGNRTLTVNNSYLTFSGSVTQNASGRFVTKQGAGHLILDGTNLWSGATTISNGWVRANAGVGLPTNSLLQLHGGILETGANLERTLGAAAGTMNWGTRDGGFAARGADARVDLNATGVRDDLEWGGTLYFVTNGARLLFGSATADRSLELYDSVSLGSSLGTTREIYAYDNATSATDRAVLSGVISGAGVLRKTGPGTVVLTGANTYSGRTVVAQGTLALSGSGTFGSTAMEFERMADAGVVGSAAGDTDIFLPLLDLANAGSVTVTAESGFGARLRFGQINRTPGGVVLFRGSALGSDAFPQINVGNIEVTNTAGLRLTGAGGAVGSTTLSIVPYAIGDSTPTGIGTEMVMYDAATGIRPLSNATEYLAGMVNAQSQLDNVKQSSAVTLTSPTTINSLVLEAGGSVTGAASGKLTINSGAILIRPGAGNLSVSNLNFGAAEGVICAQTNVTISSKITGGAGLTTWGSATTTLTAVNHALTGTTTVAAGVLDLASAAVLANVYPPAPVRVAAGATLRYTTGLYIGALDGYGTLVGVTGNNVVRFGLDNVDSTFGGSFVQGTGGPGVPGVDKLGQGTTTISGPLGTLGSSVGVTDGTLRFYDLGRSPVGTTIYGGARLVFDDTATHVDDRSGNVTLGGEYVVLGNVAANTAAGGPANCSFAFSQLGGSPTVTLVPGAGFDCQYRQRNGGNNDMCTVAANVTAFVRGNSLGQTSGTRSRFTVQSSNFNTVMIGGAGQVLADSAAPSGQAGTPQVSVVYRMYGDSSSTGLGSGFVTYDRGSDHAQNDNDPGVRLLTAAEYSSALSDGAGAVLSTIANTKLSAAVTGIDSATRVNTLLLQDNGSVAGAGSLTVESGLVMCTASNGSLATAGVVAGSGAGLRLIAPEPTDRLAVSSLLGSGLGIGLIKNGEGTVALANGANAYTGATMLAKGALRAVDGASLPSGSAVYFAGGVLESAGTFVRNLGTGGTQVQWDQYGGGGFAAQGGTLDIKLNNNTNTVIWDNTANFVQGHRNLILGSVSADNAVNFLNGLNLGTYDVAAGDRTDGLFRTIEVPDNPDSTADRGRLLNPVSGTDAKLTLVKAGAGTLELAGTNAYVCPTLIREGRLVVSGLCTNMGAWTVASNATFAAALRGAASYGVVHINGNLQFAPGSSVQVETVGGFDGFGTFYVAYADDITGTLPDAPAGYAMTVEPAGARKTLKLVSTLSFPPAVANNPVTNLTLTGASLNGTLSSPGTDATRVWVFWGTTDGASNKNGWTGSAEWDAGMPGAPLALSTNVSFPSNAVYYYTFYASNSVGEVWASPSIRFMTAPVTIAATDAGGNEEFADTGTIVIARPADATNEPLTVYFAVSGDARTNDYTSSLPLGPGSVTLPAGEATRVVTITPVYDTRFEADETLTLSLLAGGYLAGTPGAGTVTITNCLTGSGSRWVNATGGLWSVAANWGNGVVPNAVGAVANLRYFLTNSVGVILDVDATVGELDFQDTDGEVSSWQVAGTKTLTFDVAAGNARLQADSGSNTVQRPMVLNDTLEVDVAAGVTQVLNGAVTGAGGVIKLGAGLAAFNNAANDWRGPTIVSNGTLQFQPYYAAADRSDVTVAGGAVLDAANQDTVGSMSGSGTVLGDGQNDQLTFGVTDASSTFGGTFVGWGGGSGFFRKVGTGTWAVVSAMGGHTVRAVDGRVMVQGGGQAYAMAMPGAVVDFDSTAVENYNRGLVQQSMAGGEVVFRGYTNSASNLGIAGIELGAAGNPTLTIVPGGAQQALVHKNHNGSLLQVIDGSAFLLRGTNLGVQARLVADSEFNSTTFRKHLVGGDLGYIDNGDYPEYKDYGTPKAPVVRHVVTDENPAGNGANLATYHALSTAGSGTSDPGIRPLSNTEYSVSIANGEAYGTPANMENKRLGAAVTGINSPTRVTSLTLQQDGSVAGSGTLVVQSGDILALGNNTALTVANLQPGATTLRPGGEQLTLVTPDADDRLAISSAIAMPSNGLVKAGYGTVALTGGNSFTGATIVSRGALRAVDGVGLPAGSNLRFHGGVLESSGLFVRTLGTAAGQVQWLNDGYYTFADGGFAANGGPLTVRLNNSSNTLAWGTAPFVAGNRALVFGSVTADSAVDFQNGLNLGAWSGVTGGRRTIRVIDNPASAGDSARVSGPVSGADADVTLVKEGDGALILGGTNSYRGATRVNAGTLEFAGVLSNGVTVAAGGGFGAAGPVSNTGSGTVYSAVTFASNATLTVHWNGPGDYDILDVKGTLTFQPGALLRVVVLGSTGVQGRNLYVAYADTLVGMPTVTGPGGFSLAVEDVGSRKGLRLRPPAQGSVFVVR